MVKGVAPGKNPAARAVSNTFILLVKLKRHPWVRVERHWYRVEE